MVPVAFCKVCDKMTPVFIGEFEFNEPDAPEELKGMMFEAVICPICENLLNHLGDLNVEWYDIDDIKLVTNFKTEELNGRD